MSVETRERFFASGRDHVGDVLTQLHQLFGEGVRLGEVLDFGCGVGRVLLPLADHVDHAVGVDVSASMLAAVDRFAQAAGAHNLSLQSLPEFMGSSAQYDFVHSVLVFQHVPPARGMAILQHLVQQVRSGGIGMVQLHLRDSGTSATRRVRALRRRSRSVSHLLVRARRGHSREALVQVYPYDLTAVLQLLASKQIGSTIVRTDVRANGFVDATLFFQKDAA